VTLKITGLSRISRISPLFRALFPSDWDFVGSLSVPVTGKHPTDLNSAKGDPLPGKDVHFELVYNIGWGSLNGKVSGFSQNPAEKGIIRCF
jgi:hypothetical protein